MNQILCIGEALIDMICTDKNKPLSEGENFLKKPGGAPTNVAAAIGAMGGKVSLAAKVGIDPFGKHLIEIMNSFNVNTNWMLQDENHFTTFAFVSLMNNGERDFYFNRGADGQLSVDDISKINLDEFSIIHFGSATGFLQGPLNQAYASLLQSSVAKNKFVSFDPNYRELLFGNNKEAFIKQSWNFIKQSNFFKVSDEEALLLTSKQTVDEAATYFSENANAVFAITLGKTGTMLGFNGQRTIVPSIIINAIDTTGAGDAFVGMLLFQLSLLTINEIENLSIENWKSIIANANKAGARTCEYMGAMEAFKHLNKEILN